MKENFIEPCSYENCSENSIMICICSSPPESFCEEHLFEHLKIPADHKIENLESYYEFARQEKIDSLKRILNELIIIKDRFRIKLEDLLKQKTDEFYSKFENINNKTEVAIKFLETNNYKNSSNETFEKEFGQSYENNLKLLKEQLSGITNDVENIRDINIITWDNLWINKLIKLVENSDYKKLCSETVALNIDYLYSQEILNFFKSIQNFKDLDADLYNNIKDKFFNNTNFCDKENILSNVARNLSTENEELLYKIVSLSQTNLDIIQASSNSFSILVKSDYSFFQKDFSKIKIYFANLSNRFFFSN